MNNNMSAKQKEGIATYSRQSIKSSNNKLDYKDEIISKINRNKAILDELSNIDKVFNRKILDNINLKYEEFNEKIYFIKDLDSICKVDAIPKISEEILSKEPKIKIDLPKKVKEKKEYSLKLRDKLRRNNESIKKYFQEFEEQQYKLEYSNYENVNKFIIRKVFIYYMIHLAEIIKHDDREDLKALTYNIFENVDKMKNDDNWILADNEIKKYLNKYKVDVNIKKSKSIDELKNEKNNILKCINEINNDIRFIVRLQNDSNIKYILENDDGLIKMVNKIDEILFEFIEFYDGKDEINDYFNKLEEIKIIFNLLGFKYENIKSCECYVNSEADKLDLELCETLEVVKFTDIEDIEKDFLIKKVYRDAIFIYENNEKKVIRKALVSVYRYSI